MYNVEHSTLYY